MATQNLSTAAPPVDLRLTPQERMAVLYQRVRRRTEDICAPLEIEDHVVQPFDDVSPPKWHLGHTTWFIEKMTLEQHLPRYAPYRPAYGFLFNSYYESLGPRVARPRRGTLSRPTVREIRAYRHYVDRAVLEMLERLDLGDWPALLSLLTLALHHEEQHQELLIADIKAILYANPSRPHYAASSMPPLRAKTRPAFADFPRSAVKIGAEPGRFSWDNEHPRHDVIIGAYRLSERMVTNGEFAAFIADGGYDEPRWWLSDGWDIRHQRGWTAPLYWERDGATWNVFTLGGMRRMHPDEPVCHVSYFEADAYARWAAARLPTEAEWENAAALHGHGHGSGNFLEDKRFHPVPAPSDRTLVQLAGDAWEWTQSAYGPYPGYRPPPGPLGEYNGKFMSGQMVLRGGSCATPRGHYRPTYRNYFPPDKRWQFTGLRLANDADGGGS